LQIIDL